MPTATSGAREVLGYFGTSAGTFVFFNGTLPLLSTFFFVWFLGVLYGVLRQAEGVDGVLSTVVLAGGILFITLQCAGYTAEITHPATLQRFVNFVPDAQRTFESAKTGETTTWQNPDSGHSGSITPTHTYQAASGQYCREYQQTIDVGAFALHRGFVYAMQDASPGPHDRLHDAASVYRTEQT